MRRLICLLLTVCCAAVMVSCADSVGDGVLIVPSSHPSAAGTDGAVNEPAVTAYADETEAEFAETVSLETVADETVSLIPDDPGAADVLSDAEALLADDAFLGLLSQCQGQADAQTAAIAAVLAYQRMQKTEAAADNTDSGDDTVVYWTAGGSVWHITDACSALAKSKSILSGSEAQAAEAGKTRVCKRCGS